MSRGLSEAEASTLIVSGFIEPLVKELPMEYAVEMNKLIQLQMEGRWGDRTVVHRSGPMNLVRAGSAEIETDVSARSPAADRSLKVVVRHRTRVKNHLFFQRASLARRRTSRCGVMRDRVARF